MNSARLSRITALAAWLIALVGLLYLLHWLGVGQFASPSFSIDAWSDWLSQTSGPVIVVTVTRLLAIALVVYLLAATVLSVAAEVSGWNPLVTASTLFSAPAIRQLARYGAGASIAVALTLPTAANAAPATVGSGAADPSWPVLHHVDPDAGRNVPTTTASTTSTTAAPTTTTTAVPTQASVIESDPVPSSVAVVEPPTQAETYTIRGGDNLWAVASSVLQQRTGVIPSDATVSNYLKTLVAANSDVLADPANPDLVFPGQVFRLP